MYPRKRPRSIFHRLPRQSASRPTSPHSRQSWARILVQVTIYRRLLIGRDGHLDQSEAYDIS